MQNYNNNIRKIALLTSGGDAPGMNAAIRAVVRTAVYHNIEVFGVEKGYEGLLKSSFIRLDSRSVGNIIQKGGTVLKSARSEEFKTTNGRKKAYRNLKDRNIDALVVIGGDGTYTGANMLHEDFDFPVIGLPGTIDNDLYGTDYTIGFDTAVNTAMEAIDKIRDTAESHDRIFFIEVMGRHAGFIALDVGIAGGAQSVLVPEIKTDVAQLAIEIKEAIQSNKLSQLYVVAEGDDAGGVFKLVEKLNGIMPELESRIVILGHIQRGGTPTPKDRILATRLGYEAVLALKNGYTHHAIGIQNQQLNVVTLKQAIEETKPFDNSLVEMIKILSI